MPVELALTAFSIALNLRGVCVAIRLLFPLVLLFFIVHVILIIGGIALLVRAYGLGGSTYSGVEAISNNVNLLAEPRIKTGRLTMLYVAMALAFLSGGLIFLYSIWEIQAVPGQTLDATLIHTMLSRIGLGAGLVNMVTLFTLASEVGILLAATNLILVLTSSTHFTPFLYDMHSYFRKFLRANR